MISVYSEPGEVWFTKDEEKCALVIETDYPLGYSIQVTFNVFNRTVSGGTHSDIRDSFNVTVPVVRVNPPGAEGFNGAIIYPAKILSRYCEPHNPFTEMQLVDDPDNEGQFLTSMNSRIVVPFGCVIEGYHSDGTLLDTVNLLGKWARLAAQPYGGLSAVQKYSVFGSVTEISTKQSVYAVSHVDSPDRSTAISRRINYADGSSYLLNSAINDLVDQTPFSVPMGFEQVGYKAVSQGKTIASIDLLVAGELRHTFIPKDYRVPWERTYHWFNSLGGFDSVTTTGKRVESKRKRNRIIGSRFVSHFAPTTQHGFVNEVNGRLRSYTQHLGFTSRARYEAALDMLESDRVWVEIPNVGVFPIVITDEETEVPGDAEHLYSFQFSYQMSRYDYGQTPLL